MYTNETKDRVVLQERRSSCTRLRGSWTPQVHTPRTRHTYLAKPTWRFAPPQSSNTLFPVPTSRFLLNVTRFVSCRSRARTTRSSTYSQGILCCSPFLFLQLSRACVLQVTFKSEVCSFFWSILELLTQLHISQTTAYPFGLWKLLLSRNPGRWISAEDTICIILKSNQPVWAFT